MKKQVLLGTTNQAKIAHLQEAFESLPIEILSSRDLNIEITVEEDGKSPEENALKKAKAYFAEAKIPTLATDAGLHIEQFPADKQPGVFVRRIYGADRAVSDAEMLDYYVSELDKVGGESIGIWNVSVVLVTSVDTIFCFAYPLKILLTAQKSDILIPGAPISSLAIDPATGRYYSEMTFKERPSSRVIFEFMKQHLEKL